MIRAQLEGYQKLQKRLKDLPPRAAKAAQAAMVREAGAAMDLAQKAVPVKTGRLRSSAFVTVFKTVTNFGYRAPYAAMVHERPTGRGYKWFERAVRQSFRGLANRVAAAVKRAM